jgi:hypothetical protein
MSTLPPTLFTLVVFAMTITALLVIGGVLFGVFHVLQYERRRQIRQTTAQDMSIGAPLIGAT